MKRIFYVIVTLFFVSFCTLPVYAEVIDVNVVNDVKIETPSSPSSPTNVTISALTDTTVIVSWNAVTSATQYNIYLNGKVYSGSNSPQALLSGLSPYTNYSLYVVANNSGGDSPKSSDIEFKTLSPIPLEPSNPNVITSNNTAKFSWQPLTANYNITQYTVYLDGKANTTIQPITGIQALTINDLSPGNHTVSVSATNDNKEGPQSQIVTFTISEVPAPLELQFYNKSSNKAWFSWQPVPGASSYKISINNEFVGQTYQPTFIAQNLSADTSYQISVVTVMPDGQMSQSTNIEVKTNSIEPIITAASLKNKLIEYLPDTQIYIEILFAVVAALTIATNLRSIFTRVRY